MTGAEEGVVEGGGGICFSFIPFVAMPPSFFSFSFPYIRYAFQSMKENQYDKNGMEPYLATAFYGRCFLRLLAFHTFPLYNVRIL